MGRQVTRGTRGRSAALLLLSGILGLVLVAPAAAAPPDVTFETAAATSKLGESITFTVRFSSPVAPRRVELLSHLPSSADDGDSVADAVVTQEGGAYLATVISLGHTLPNTTIVYRFRVTTPDDAVTSEEQRVTVTDDRFTWHVREGALIRLHWHEGNDAFADRALKVGEDGLARAMTLLGVTETEPVDFFVYADEAAFRSALGPGTSENIGGRAVPSIRTLFALIRPAEIGSDWIDHVIPHELTHLVFGTASDNPYHFPPKWLNEGLAVYLEPGGYSIDWRAHVEVAAREGTLIPLDGLALDFPADRDTFHLSYSESVSAVDYFVRHYGQETLTKLIRSYAEGVSDDDAFRAATGADVKAFNDAWIAQLDGHAAPAVGPQPAPPGPIPSDWTAPASTPAATATPVPTGSPGPTSSAGSSTTPGPSATQAPSTTPGESAGPGGSTAPATAAPAGRSSAPGASGTSTAAGVGAPVSPSPAATTGTGSSIPSGGDMVPLVAIVGGVGLLLVIVGLLLTRRRQPPAPPTPRAPPPPPAG